MFDAPPVQREIKEHTNLFKTQDGAELVGHFYAPKRPFAVVVLNGATGVPQRFYTHFARWLAAERGMACLTYDYRDTGRSLSGSMRHSRADMIDWGTSDQSAARSAARKAYPGVPLWIIGHSLGAMLLPNQRDLGQVVRVIGVASGRVHHNDHPWPYRATALAFWFGIGPVATALCGYLPGNALRFGDDVPAGVYWQWRRWCTSPEFYTPDLGDRLNPPAWNDDIPARLIAFADDDLIPPQCVARLGQAYEGKAEHVVIDPADHGLDSVGHLGAFSRRNRAIWSRLLEG
ncbi:MAG: alpha/beta fold hydrolase [Pseudomonadota bacterium]